MMRELERDHRIVSFRLTIIDRPGMLGQISTLLGKLGANILEVHHRRTFLDVPAKGTRLDLTVETRDQAHAEAIEAALAAQGLPVQRLGAGGPTGKALPCPAALALQIAGEEICRTMSYTSPEDRGFEAISPDRPTLMTR